MAREPNAAQRFLLAHIAAWTETTTQAGITREAQNALIERRFKKVYRDLGKA